MLVLSEVESIKGICCKARLKVGSNLHVAESEDFDQGLAPADSLVRDKAASVGPGKRISNSIDIYGIGSDK